MNKLKQWVRIWWLWLKKEFVIANSHCVRCGKRGASACSLANLAKLCDRCATAVCREAEKTAPSSIETDLLPRAKSPNTTFGWIGNAWKQNNTTQEKNND
jgi:hypothetical protein